MAEYVLDTNVFIHAPGQIPYENAVVPPAVTAELEREEPQRRFDLTGVDVFEPSATSVEMVRHAADQIGEELSATDVAVVALAVDRDATAVSDDYGVQNVCEALDVGYEAFMQEGIEEGVEWRRVCRDCGREVETGEECPVCGGDVKQVPRD